MFSIDAPSLSSYSSSPYQQFTESIGIDIPTSYIYHLRVEDIVHRFDQLHQSNLPLHLIALATNTFTYQRIPRLINHFQTKSIPCIASEIYRAHPIKPGVILPVIVEASHTPISDAIADLNQTLNTCIDLEKQYLTKVIYNYSFSLLNYIFVKLVCENHRCSRDRCLCRTCAGAKYAEFPFPGGIRLH